MASQPMIANPLGWAHLRLLGGWRRTFTICIVYFLASGLLMYLFYRAIRQDVTLSSFANGSLVFFLFAQSALLYFGGTNAIKRAVLRDYTTDMINSHRLTAMSGHTASLGYLTGSTSQITALALTTWLICTLLAPLGSSTSNAAFLGPTMIMAMTGCSALLCWTLSLLAAICSKGKISVIGALIGLGIAANAQVIYIVPGLGLLIPASLFASLKGAASTTPLSDYGGIFVGMTAQIVLSLALFLAAARKYTRDDVPALTGPLAYGLLALLALIGAVGFSFVPEMSPGFRYLIPAICTRGDVQLVGTLIGLLLAGLIPVLASTKDSANWAKRLARDPQPRGRAPRPYWESTVITSLLALGILYIVLARDARTILAFKERLSFVSQLTYVALAYWLAIAAVAGFARIGYRNSPRINWLLILYIIVFWLLPMFVDLAIEAIQGSGLPMGRTMLFTCSPIGAWIATCTSLDAPVLPGLLLQAVIVAFALLLAGRRRPAAVARKLASE